MKSSECAPRQYCRIYGRDLPSSSTVTGMREAAGGRKPAAAKPLCNFVEIDVVYFAVFCICDAAILPPALYEHVRRR